MPFSVAQGLRIVALPLILLLVVAFACIGPAAASDQDPERFGWKLSYDDAGYIVSETGPAGNETRFQYRFDAANRLQQAVRSAANGAPVVRDYDDAGRLRQMQDGSGTVSYGYDARGRLIRADRQGGSPIAYSYDTQDRLTRLAVGDFYRVDYDYDFLGRLATMKTPAGEVRYQYLTGQGEVVRTLPNGVRTIWYHDARGRLVRLVHADPKNVVLTDYRYQYRPGGLLAAIAEQTGAGEVVWSYGYDPTGRLISVKGSQSYQYGYDSAGDRIRAAGSSGPAQICTYDWLGRLLLVNDKRAEHDAAGNLTSVTDGDAVLDYRYDQDGRLVGALNGAVSYRYDGDGRLIARRAAGVDATFVSDPLARIWRPLVIAENAGTRTLIVWQAEQPLLTIRDGKAEFLLEDYLGSVRMTTDAHGGVVKRFEYDPYGTLQGPASSGDFAPRYAGLFWDRQARIYLAGHRAYAAFAGAFIQVEPQPRVPGPLDGKRGLYAYSGGDPVNFRDIDGLRPELEPNKQDAPWLNYYVLGQLEQDEIDIASQLYGGVKSMADIASLGGDQQADVRTLAVDKFVTDHASYHAYGLYDYTGSKFDKIENTIIPTDYGGVNLDWATTLGHASLILEMPPDLLYGAGKTAWNVLGPLNHEKPWPNWHDPYPVSDRNAISWLQALYNPADPLDQVVLAQSQRNSTVPEIAAILQIYAHPQPFAPLATPAQAPTGFSAGASFQASSTPLSGAELAAWRAAQQTGSGPSGSTAVGNGGRMGAGSALQQDSNTSLDSALTPSRVGGVYLGGAGRSLAGLGLLSGVTPGPNGNLILVGQGGGQIRLPPLRLDDVVTVFRSVYLDGEGPTVTIDPNPKDPEGPAMIIKNSKATENTYVGWILYQADRMMKGYTLGTDNITRQSVVSTVPGYRDVLDKIYFGGEDSVKLRQRGVWERFWIVPAEVNRFGGPRNKLTWIDVPLKAKTQEMKWQNGKLVDDPAGKSSPGALAFTTWFTGYYDLIAHERFLTPPAESGITEPVGIFTELQRIALMTAIAERLRDQGVPMPFWMRGYEVRRVPFDQTTPALEVPRSNGRIAARIYGGVGTSAPDAAVANFGPNADLSKLDRQHADKVRASLALAANLEQAVRAQVQQTEPFKVQALTQQGADYQALDLPGEDTKALAPARFDAVDLTVPVEGGDPIRLVRSYNSFFVPDGPWGKGWTLDLPQLVKVNVPTQRDDTGATYQTAFELVTPLNTQYARFSRIEAVPALGGNRLQVPDQSGPFFGLAYGKADFLSGPTHQLLLKDGTVWHFGDNAQIVATERGGSRVVYQRDDQGRLTRIIGLRARTTVAAIDLKYNTADQIESARTTIPKQDVVARYDFDGAKRLRGVETRLGRLGYEYDKAMVTEVTFQSRAADGTLADTKVIHRFQYDPRGQLIAEFDANGKRTDYVVGSDATGSTMTVRHPGSGGGSDMVRYDRDLRPTEAKGSDGTQAKWSYPPEGGVMLDIAAPDQPPVRIADSADRRTRTVQLDKDRTLTARYDAADRLTSIDDTGSPVLRREFSSDGRLIQSIAGTSATTLEYDRDGLLSSTILSPPAEKGQLEHWQATKFDATGAPREVTDYRGLQILADYTDTGQLQSVVTKRDGRNLGFAIERDAAGRVSAVKSSWGDQKFTYDAAGRLTRVDDEDGGQAVAAEWSSGLLRKLRSPGGGEYSLAYYEAGKHRGSLESVALPDLTEVRYGYDDANRLSQVDVGVAYRLSLDYDASGRVTGWWYAPPKR